MRKGLLTLCGAVVLPFLAAGSVGAGPFWQSDLVCETSIGAPARRPYAVIKYPSGDLWLSVIRGLPPRMAVTCEIHCFLNQESKTGPCGVTDARGTLAPQILPAFAPLPCVGVDLTLFSAAGLLCVDGFIGPTP